MLCGTGECWKRGLWWLSALERWLKVGRDGVRCPEGCNHGLCCGGAGECWKRGLWGLSALERWLKVGRDGSGIEGVLGGFKLLDIGCFSC